LADTEQLCCFAIGDSPISHQLYEQESLHLSGYLLFAEPRESQNLFWYCHVNLNLSHLFSPSCLLRST
jgi:hypothetical protein